MPLNEMTADDPDCDDLEPEQENNGDISDSLSSSSKYVAKSVVK